MPELLPVDLDTERDLVAFLGTRQDERAGLLARFVAQKHLRNGYERPLQADARGRGTEVIGRRLAQLRAEVSAIQLILEQYEWLLADHSAKPIPESHAMVATLSWVVRVLAVPYRDHPGYRQEFAPR